MRYRLFQYAEHSAHHPQVIDLALATSRGLVNLDSVGRVIRMSDDLIDLGNYTETGHKRRKTRSAAAVRRYFA